MELRSHSSSSMTIAQPFLVTMFFSVFKVKILFKNVTDHLYAVLKPLIDPDRKVTMIIEEYDVDLSDVRNQRGSFKEAFENMMNAISGSVRRQIINMTAKGIHTRIAKVLFWK